MTKDAKTARLDRLRSLQSELDALTAKETKFKYKLPAEHRRIEGEMAKVRAAGETKAEPTLAIDG